MNWDIECYDWKTLFADGTAEHVPAAIIELGKASTIEGAEQFYWLIDNTVVTQGVTFPAALNAIPCLLSVFQSASRFAQEFFLELLVQIAAGEPSSSIRHIDLSEFRCLCRKEISYGIAIYFTYLRSGTEAERCHCADLLGICSENSEFLKDRVVFHFKKLIEIESSPAVRALVINWLEALSK